MYIVFSLGGFLIHPFLFYFHLSDVIVRVRLLHYVIRSVITNGGQVIGTTLLGIMVVVGFGLVGWFAYGGSYGTAELDALHNDSLYNFILDHIDYGLRSAPVFSNAPGE